MSNFPWVRKGKTRHKKCFIFITLCVESPRWVRARGARRRNGIVFFENEPDFCVESPRWARTRKTQHKHRLVFCAREATFVCRISPVGADRGDSIQTWLSFLSERSQIFVSNLPGGCGLARFDTQMAYLSARKKQNVESPRRDSI